MLRKNIIEEIINFQLWEENLRHWSLYQWREMVKGFSSPFYLGDLRFMFISTGSIHSDRIHRLRVPLWFAPTPFLEIITFLHQRKRYKNTNSNSERLLFYFYLFFSSKKEYFYTNTATFFVEIGKMLFLLVLKILLQERKGWHKKCLSISMCVLAEVNFWRIEWV